MEINKQDKEKILLIKLLNKSLEALGLTTRCKEDQSKITINSIKEIDVLDTGDNSDIARNTEVSLTFTDEDDNSHNTTLVYRRLSPEIIFNKGVEGEMVDTLEGKKYLKAYRHLDGSHDAIHRPEDAASTLSTVLNKYKETFSLAKDTEVTIKSFDFIEPDNIRGTTKLEFFTENSLMFTPKGFKAPTLYRDPNFGELAGTHRTGGEQTIYFEVVSSSTFKENFGRDLNEIAGNTTIWLPVKTAEIPQNYFKVVSPRPEGEKHNISLRKIPYLTKVHDGAFENVELQLSHPDEFDSDKVKDSDWLLGSVSLIGDRAFSNATIGSRPNSHSKEVKGLTFGNEDLVIGDEAFKEGSIFYNFKFSSLKAYAKMIKDGRYFVKGIRLSDDEDYDRKIEELTSPDSAYSVFKFKGREGFDEDEVILSLNSEEIFGKYRDIFVSDEGDFPNILTRLSFVELKGDAKTLSFPINSFQGVSLKEWHATIGQEYQRGSFNNATIEKFYCQADTEDSAVTISTSSFIGATINEIYVPDQHTKEGLEGILTNLSNTPRYIIAEPPAPDHEDEDEEEESEEVPSSLEGDGMSY